MLKQVVLDGRVLMVVPQVSRIVLLLTTFGLAGCLPTASGVEIDTLEIFDRVGDGYVMVAAHRGGYIANGSVMYPENSLAAIQNSIRLGVDIVEIDIRMTADGGLVAMHDTSVNRTTTGSGNVSSLTLEQVFNLRLLGPDGEASNELVPTLEQVMRAANGHVMVNLDKVDITNAELMARVMNVLRDTGTVDHAIFKGGATPEQVAAVRQQYPDDTIIYMPIVSNRNEASLLSTLNSHTPPAVEIIFSNDETSMLSKTILSTAEQLDTHLWINSLWASLDGGHHDAIAIDGDADGSWGWLVDKGATIIQTDNSAQLLKYLEKNGLREYQHRPVIDVLGDFNGDGVVNLLDWDPFVAHQRTELSHLSSDEAMRAGDLNGNGLHDLGDFAKFRCLLEAASQHAAFRSESTDATAVPEPSSWSLLFCITCYLSMALCHMRLFDPVSK
ncbi:putative glycerophosphoryl diester phosphodiesterase 1 [Aeoliella mucimassa]|uniref:Putative glycerophosphoryl diester phosphodiesterase 1 n=2 Tax=Aeoliella mucimassa TaxID=2527972 RepID=A0A518APR2_9BACT|nr:putative glycerophosphoryl diester phosphodiesterase 1 [Aeoliella mucimassa]